MSIQQVARLRKQLQAKQMGLSGKSGLSVSARNDPHQLRTDSHKLNKTWDLHSIKF
jgi:hypothetical protein